MVVAALAPLRPQGPPPQRHGAAPEETPRGAPVGSWKRPVEDALVGCARAGVWDGRVMSVHGAQRG
eukprot:141035-Chlamydomonas_euryale.AAC.5